jgi:hypothetical protein
MLHEEDNNNILGTVSLSYIYIYIYISYTLILHIVTWTVMVVGFTSTYAISAYHH